MRGSIPLLGLLVGLAAAGCTLLGGERGAAGKVAGEGPEAVLDEDDDDGDEQQVALSQVPASIRQAALDAVPGLVLEDAETEVENGVLVYCLEGTANGKEYEVEVSAGGEVLEVEEEDDGEDEDEDP